MDLRGGSAMTGRKIRRKSQKKKKPQLKIRGMKLWLFFGINSFDRRTRILDRAFCHRTADRLQCRGEVLCKAGGTKIKDAAKTSRAARLCKRKPSSRPGECRKSSERPAANQADAAGQTDARKPQRKQQTASSRRKATCCSSALFDAKAAGVV